MAHEGTRYLVEGIIPDYATLGFLTAYAKVGKSTFGQALGAAVATGRPFLDRATQARRVLIIAAEDPREYTAWLARHLDVPPGVMTFYTKPIRLDARGLAAVATTIRTDGYGFVIIASWQAVIRGLIRDENDNAGAVGVVEHVKATARETGIPWLIDAHAGKGEDQSDEADPSKALRGASAAAGAADYLLSLRYAKGTFGTQRRLSGKGRFVDFAPMFLDFDASTGSYAVLGESGPQAAQETTWRLIVETGALTSTPQGIDQIARLAGLGPATGRLSGGARRRVREALRGRPGIVQTSTTRRGQTTTQYHRIEEETC